MKTRTAEEWQQIMENYRASGRNCPYRQKYNHILNLIGPALGSRFPGAKGDQIHGRSASRLSRQQCDLKQNRSLKCQKHAFAEQRTKLFPRIASRKVEHAASLPFF